MEHKTLKRLDKFISRFRLPFRRISLVLMLLMFVGSFVIYIPKNHGAMTSTIINFTLYMVALVFLFMLFVFNYTGTYGDSRSSRYFESMVVLLYFIVFIAGVTVSLEGHPEYRTVVVVFDVLSYFMSPFFYMVFWGYQYSMYHPKKWAKELTIIFMSICIIDMLVSLTNPLTGLQYTVNEMGYSEYLYNDMTTCVLLFAMSIVFTVYIINIECSLRKMLSMLSYFMFPVVLIIVNFLAYVFSPQLQLAAMSSIASVASLYLVFFNVHTDQKNELIRKRAEYTEMRSALMLSQIQPHFIYNCLATISALCDFDPKQAKDTTNKFSDYLRANIDAMSSNALIPFEKELKHVEAYTDLEKTRFGEKLSVEYDIKAKDFLVPSLTLQPIVENAVKHGVCRKRGGGKVRITSFETAEEYCIIVEDTGVGFDSKKEYENEEGKHVGIVNVKHRLQSLVGGSLKVESTPGEGTSAKITVPKEMTV